jgi:FMN phosphatase YigB (HAD superfamily)
MMQRILARVANMASRNVIFSDFDGVICAEQTFWALYWPQVVADVQSRVGNVSEAELRRIATSDKQADCPVHALARHFGLSRRWIEAQYSRIPRMITEAQWASVIQPNPPMAACLRALMARGVRLVIVSQGTVDHIRCAAIAAGLWYGLLEHCVIVDRTAATGWAKTTVWPYVVAIYRHGFPRAMVDDSAKNLPSAARLGIPTVHAGTGAPVSALDAFNAF